VQNAPTPAGEGSPRQQSFVTVSVDMFLKLYKCFSSENCNPEYAIKSHRNVTDKKGILLATNNETSSSNC